MWGGGDEMTEKSERRLFGRQRRANVDVPRDRRYTVKVNAEEDAQLRARAVVAGVTVPRLMFESAMNAHIETDTARQEVIAEFFAVRRLMANVANNVNQLAKYANTESVFPQDAEAIVAEYRAIVPRLSDALDRLSES
jgi:aminoglycoside phosphotransferase family enzyme